MKVVGKMCLKNENKNVYILSNDHTLCIITMKGEHRRIFNGV